MKPASQKRLVFIDDDKDNRRQWLEWSKCNGYFALAFESAYDANTVRADCYIFDVSAVASWTGSLQGAYSPIARLMQDHPGAEIIIGSCMSRNYVEDVLDEVEKVAGRRPKFFDAASGFTGLEAVMTTLWTSNP